MSWTPFTRNVWFAVTTLCCTLYSLNAQLVGPPYLQYGNITQWNDTAQIVSSGANQGWAVVECGDGSVMAEVSFLQPGGTFQGAVSIFNGVNGRNWNYNTTVAICTTSDSQGPYGTIQMTANCQTIIVSCFPVHPIIRYDIVEWISVTQTWNNTATLTYTCPFPFCTTGFGTDTDICNDRSAIVTGLTAYNGGAGAILIWTPVPGTFNWVLNSTIQGNGTYPGQVSQGYSVRFIKSVPCNLVFWAGESPTTGKNQTIWMANLTSNNSSWAQFGNPLTISTIDTGGFFEQLATNSDGTILALGNSITGASTSYVHIIKRTGAVLSLFQTIPQPFDAGVNTNFGAQLWMTPSSRILLVGSLGGDCGGLGGGAVWLFTLNSNSMFVSNGTKMCAASGPMVGPISGFILSGINDGSSFVVSTVSPPSSGAPVHDGGVYTFTPGPCFSNPCLNGGLCQSGTNFPTNYSCLCTDQFTGSTNCSIPASPPYFQVGSMIQPTLPLTTTSEVARPMCPSGQSILNVVTSFGVGYEIDIFNLNVTTNTFEYNTTISSALLFGLAGVIFPSFSGNCTTLVVGCPNASPPSVIVLDLINGVWTKTATLLFATGSIGVGIDVVLSLDRTIIMAGAIQYNTIGAVVFWTAVPGTFNWTLNANLTGTGLIGAVQFQGRSVVLTPSIPCTTAFWFGYDQPTRIFPTIWMARLIGGKWQTIGTNFTIPIGCTSLNVPQIATNANGSVVIMGNGQNGGSTSSGEVYVINNNGTSMTLFQTISPPSDAVLCPSLSLGLLFGSVVWMDQTGLLAAIAAGQDNCGIGAWWFYKRANLTSNFTVVGTKMYGSPSDTDTFNGWGISGSLDGFRMAVSTASGIPGVAGNGGIFAFQTTNPCVSAPCFNGGTCTFTNATIYVCHCPYGFGGSTCQIPWTYIQTGPFLQPTSPQTEFNPPSRPMCPSGQSVMNFVAATGGGTTDIAIYNLNTTTDTFQYNTTIFATLTCQNSISSAAFSGNCTTIVVGCFVDAPYPFLVVLDLINGTWNNTATLFFGSLTNTQLGFDVVVSLDRTVIMAGAPLYNKGAVVFWNAVPGTLNWTLNSNLTGPGLLAAIQLQGTSVSLVPTIPCTKAFWFGFDHTDSILPTLWTANLIGGTWQLIGSNFSISTRINGYYTPQIGVNSNGTAVIMANFNNNGAGGEVYIVNNGGGGASMSLFQIIHPPSDADPFSCPGTPIQFGTSVWMDTTGTLAAIGAGNDACGTGAWWVYKRDNIMTPFLVAGPKMFGNPSDTLTANGWGISGSLDGFRMAIGASSTGGIANGGGVFTFQSQSLCLPNPCQNGGTCSTLNLTASTCQCVPGFSGNLCQTLIDNCVSLPCQNAGTCSNIVNGFTCACVFGSTGATCQTLVDNCASTPCQNGGTCADGVGSYNCTCAPGFSGVMCQIRNATSVCASTPCQNGGTCVASGLSYNCTCPSGSRRPVCASCSVGTFSKDGVSCVACESGSYQNVSGSAQCVQCPANTFTGSSGASACTACPSGFVATLSLGSQNCTALSASSNSGVSLSAGAIAGIVVAGVVLIVLGVALWFWFSSTSTAVAATATSSSVPLASVPPTKSLFRHSILPAKPFFRSSV